MTPGEWAGFGAGVIAVLSGVLIGLRFLVKGWLNELRPNSGSSIKDAVDRIDQRSLRLEKRVDDLFVLLVSHNLIMATKRKPKKKPVRKRRTTKEPVLTKLDFWAIAANEVYMAAVNLEWMRAQL
jgi:hypothetical protein